MKKEKKKLDKSFLKNKMYNLLTYLIYNSFKTQIRFLKYLKQMRFLKIKLRKINNFKFQKIKNCNWIIQIKNYWIKIRELNNQIKN